MGIFIGDSDFEEMPSDKTTAPNVCVSQPAVPFLDQGWSTIHLQPSILRCSCLDQCVADLKLTKPTVSV